jgi:hypothetical protein
VEDKQTEAKRAGVRAKKSATKVNPMVSDGSKPRPKKVSK